MIHLTCTSCKNVLSIDNAFAGGVCRCQFCGTIQTVPAQLKGTGEQIAVAAGPGPKALYENKARSGPGSGLDDLAGIVASSGLSDGHLRRSPAAASPLLRNPAFLLSVAGAVIVILLLAIVLVWLLRSRPQVPGGTSNQSVPGTMSAVAATDENSNAVGSETASAAPAVVAVSGPNCCGIKLAADSVAYVIDNGSSAENLVDYEKAAVYRSVQSLTGSRRFAIFFWNNSSRSFGPAPADAAQIDKARAELDEVGAYDVTEPQDAVGKALAQKPGEIVLITAKGLEINDDSAEAILKLAANTATKIHVLDIDGSRDDTALAKIAAKSGGTFAVISQADLKRAGD